MNCDEEYNILITLSVILILVVVSVLFLSQQDELIRLRDGSKIQVVQLRKMETDNIFLQKQLVRYRQVAQETEKQGNQATSSIADLLLSEEEIGSNYIKNPEISSEFVVLHSGTLKEVYGENNYNIFFGDYNVVDGYVNSFFNKKYYEDMNDGALKAQMNFLFDRITNTVIKFDSIDEAKKYFSDKISDHIEDEKGAVELGLKENYIEIEMFENKIGEDSLFKKYSYSTQWYYEPLNYNAYIIWFRKADKVVLLESVFIDDLYKKELVLDLVRKVESKISSK